MKFKSKSLSKNIEKLNNMLEELYYVSEDKKKLILNNFLAGIFRGVGIGIGVTIVTAILVLFLQRIVTLNIPIIGDYVADIIDILEKKQY